ncbi:MULTISPECIES: diacylglycerol kinase family protein [Microbacterium]|uniref:diacylglycerol kinase family protein n=1 Tax=Microbacterium TaxID=33882 RepID=UPI000D64F520|nr:MULTISPECIES: diacylglycerol kinase family protein [Microbacterium]
MAAASGSGEDVPTDGVPADDLRTRDGSTEGAPVEDLRTGEIPTDLDPHPADAVYADGPDTAELELADAAATADAAPATASGAEAPDGQGAAGEDADSSAAKRSGAHADDAPDPGKAAEPDDVIREPGDVAADTADDESGEARRVGPEGETRPMETDGERPSPKAALVYNPIKVDADTLRDTVTRLAAEAGWSEPLFYETTVDDLGDDVTRQALEEGVDTVLVAGGDGTVRAVSEAMSGSGVPLAIVPSGTGNLLARNLRLPLTEPEAMVRAVFDGDTLPMDVGWTELARPDGSTAEHAFVVMGGIGLDAAMIANTNPQLKKTVGWVAYVDGAARALPAAKPFRVVYELPGHRLHSSRVQSVLFANCGKLPAGLDLIPEASIADGALDIVIFQPKGPFGWLFVWRRVAWDNSFLRRFRAGRRVLSLRTKDNAVVYSRGAGIELATQKPQPVQLDGDEFGEALSVKTRVEPSSLLVVVPKGHTTHDL